MKTNKTHFPPRSICWQWIILLLLLISYKHGNAQQGFGVEVRPGLHFPTKDLVDANLDIGIGLEGVITYKFLDHLGIYTGWGSNTFKATESFAGPQNNFRETGYALGLQYSHRIAQLKYNYLIRGGTIFNKMKVTNPSGNTLSKSSHSLGWQFEIGTLLHLNDHWKLLPSIRFRSLNSDINIEPVTTRTELNYISVGIGLIYFWELKKR